jgi:3-oxoacyl-[acyl-carrier protein] reductase
MDVNGKVALVTGAARRIGRGIALGLAERGFDVVVHYRTSEPEAREVVDTIASMGRRALAIRADVTRPDEVTRMFERASAELGGVDILVNCVGDYERATLAATPLDDWERVFASNVTSAFLVSRAALAHMKTGGWGRIVNIGFSTTSLLRARPGITAYTAAKTALVSMTRSLALEVAADGITANVINLGYFDLPDMPAYERRMAPKVPMRRLGTVDELAAVVAFLASDDAAYLTGNALELSGGFGL